MPIRNFRFRFLPLWLLEYLHFVRPSLSFILSLAVICITRHHDSEVLRFLQPGRPEYRSTITSNREETTCSTERGVAHSK